MAEGTDSRASTNPSTSNHKAIFQMRESNVGGSFGAAIFEYEVEIGQMSLQQSPVHMFGQNVRGVRAAGDHFELEITHAEFVLDP